MKRAIVLYEAPASAMQPKGVADANSNVVGFSIMQGDSLDDITALLNDHPHLHIPGASIKVLEAMSIPGT
jgi:hypothetical protein